MLTFKEEKEYAIKMWKEIRSMLRRRTQLDDMYYTNAIAFIKRSILAKYNYNIDSNIRPRSRYYTPTIKWKYDCILCQYASKDGSRSGCAACPLVRMGFPACQDTCSPYSIVGNAFVDNYRKEDAIVSAERSCNIIIRAIRKLTKRINYDKI